MHFLIVFHMQTHQVLGGPVAHKRTVTPECRIAVTSVSPKAEECSNCALPVRIKSKVYGY